MSTAFYTTLEGSCMSMPKPKIYIDGKEGTTGLQIYDRLALRKDIELLLIDEDKRKDVQARKELLNEADLVFLCLPDDAAVEAVSLIEDPSVRVIDASTAHRVAPGWDYGMAELSSQHRERIVKSKRVANPGCHASGFITAVYPLTACRLIPEDYPLTAFSLTGYTGGGKKMIAQYEQEIRPWPLQAPRIYSLGLRHKHLPEMQTICGLAHPPVFCPVVDDYAKGMAVTVMLENRLLPGDMTTEKIHTVLQNRYKDQALIKVAPLGWDGSISANAMDGKDTLALIVSGHHDQTIITALFDNLGKGASGAAVQNMNLMLGFPETEGLNL